jgi:hypothetical protein
MHTSIAKFPHNTYILAGFEPGASAHQVDGMPSAPRCQDTRTAFLKREFVPRGELWLLRSNLAEVELWTLRSNLVS